MADRQFIWQMIAAFLIASLLYGCASNSRYNGVKIEFVASEMPTFESVDVIWTVDGEDVYMDADMIKYNRDQQIAVAVIAIPEIEGKVAVEYDTMRIVRKVEDAYCSTTVIIK